MSYMPRHGKGVGAVRSDDEVYEEFTKMCERLGAPVMQRWAWDKFRSESGFCNTPNNVDAILRNNHRKKDKLNDH